MAYYAKIKALPDLAIFESKDYRDAFIAGEDEYANCYDAMSPQNGFPREEVSEMDALAAYGDYIYDSKLYSKDDYGDENIQWLRLATIEGDGLSSMDGEYIL